MSNNLKIVSNYDFSFSIQAIYSLGLLIQLHASKLNVGWFITGSKPLKQKFQWMN